MAAEPSTDQVVVISATVEPQPKPTTKTHDEDLNKPKVNGIIESSDKAAAGQRPEAVREQSLSATVSTSGGSDADVPRTDWVQQKNEEKPQGRAAAAAKKTATFKAVTVNKTFLASKTSPSISTLKIGDRPSSTSSTPPPGTSGSTASRPRLVAKLVSGVRDSSPRHGHLANGGKPAAAPDPAAVWNKNRPPEPKKFTDEELKQYGIHMASRLNEQDAQGQNKWADIDDDDEDWAPEAITWGDGTKTKIPQHDDPTAAPPPGVSPFTKLRMHDKSRVSKDAESASSLLSKSANFPIGKGLVLKSAAQDKPALVAKPPAPPAPAKSPWATLPPIDRASPASAEAATVVQSPWKETAPVKAVPINAQPKEIAADDFNRASWRDGGPRHNRELFNSHSGRYEPVTDRRNSVRLEHKPALLQRPQPLDHPAEPSEAFQMSRTSQDASSGRRRRASSNISGSSGSIALRLIRGHDGPPQPTNEASSARRASLVHAVEAASVPNAEPVADHASPKPQPSQAWGSTPASKASNATTPSAQAKGPQPVTSDLPIDEVEYQKKLMRERVELARKRRQKEEAREEEAKRECIQKKLEALRPPEKKSDKKDAAVKGSLAKPLHIQRREVPGPASAPKEQAVPEKSTQSDNDPVSKASASELKVTSPKGQPSASMRSRPAPHEGPRADAWTGSGPRPERLTPWAAGAPPPPAGRNVWGSPDIDKGLGNGTFNPDLGRVVGATLPAARGHQSPAPIAPPNGMRAPSQSHDGNRLPSDASVPASVPPGPSLSNKWVADVIDGDNKINAAAQAERAARDRRLADQGLTIEQAQPVIKDSWRPVHLPGDGTRRPVAAADTPAHQPGPWKAVGERLNQGLASVNDAAPLAKAGVIGSGNTALLVNAGQNLPPQSRGSRFFPARDYRLDIGPVIEQSRPASPTPPPPTMEDHPAYEGNAVHPLVSFPPPQPIVKLPPASLGAEPPTGRPDRDADRAARALFAQKPNTIVEGSKSQDSWQQKIQNLLNGNKTSPPKTLVIEPSSRSVLDHNHHQSPATVSLPSPAPAGTACISRCSTTKPMAEECFEEQEMRSLPQIRLPHKAPEAAWQPAAGSSKPLPKRFAVQASAGELFHLVDVIGSSVTVRVHFPSMKEAKLVNLPVSAIRGGRGGHGRPPRRSSPRVQRGGKKDASQIHAGAQSGSGNSGRASDGSAKNRGGDNLSRQAHPRS